MKNPNKKPMGLLAKIVLGLAAFFIGVPVLFSIIGYAMMPAEEKAQMHQQSMERVAADEAAVEQKAATEAAAKAEADKTAAADQEARMLIANLCIWSQDAVKAQLRAPATAQFPGCVMGLNEYKIRGTPDQKKYWVFGHVDSQNGFGALLRSNWVVIFERAGPGAQFSITQVSIE